MIPWPIAKRLVEPLAAAVLGTLVDHALLSDAIAKAILAVVRAVVGAV